MSRPTLSAVLIAQNEASRLSRLLPALDWIDEVIIVDGGSQDGTDGVARDRGARVHYRPFDDFASQRNAGVDLARTDWILCLDADEWPTAALAREIGCRIRESRWSAYHVPIRSTIFGRRFRYSGTQDDRPIRLFRRGSARWLGRVHERLAVTGRVGILRGSLEHNTIPDIKTFLRKMHHYTTLEAEARVQSARVPQFADAWLAPLGETLRRLVYKHGWLDGPEGWMFALLSGLSVRIAADKHAELAYAGATLDIARKPCRRRVAAGRNLFFLASSERIRRHIFLGND